VAIDKLTLMMQLVILTKGMKEENKKRSKSKELQKEGL